MFNLQGVYCIALRTQGSQPVSQSASQPASQPDERTFPAFQYSAQMSFSVVCVGLSELSWSSGWMGEWVDSQVQKTFLMFDCRDVDHPARVVNWGCVGVVFFQMEIL